MQGGIYVVELIDKFTLAFPLLIVVLLEVLVVSYIYGSAQLTLLHQSMLNTFLALSAFRLHFLCCLFHLFRKISGCCEFGYECDGAWKVSSPE